jgi:quinol---cytochrome c reductase cytochrome c subunit, bacillus type
MGTTPTTPRGLQEPSRKPVRITVPEESKVRYGDSFWPKTPFQSIFYITVLFIGLIALAVLSPAPLQDPADPLNHAAIDPKPEWYYLFLFQLLKYFPGPFIIIGTAVIPGVLTVLLLLVPFYDRNWSRKISRRPVAAISMSGAMLAIIFLTWGGLNFPTPNFSAGSQVAGGTPQGGPSGAGGPGANSGGSAPSISPQVATIFSAHCAACHISQQLGGLNLSNYAGLIKGGNVVSGPVIVPGDHKASVLYKIIQPTGPWPGGNRMPLGGPYLSSGDITTIAGWIDSLGKKAAGSTSGTTAGAGATGGNVVSFKKDVQPIFSAHCATCHLNGIASGGLQLTYAGIMKGGSVVPGPAVTPGNHAKSTLYQIIQPTGPWPGGQRMPLGGPYLANAQIQTIATWIDQGAKNN